MTKTLCYPREVAESLLAECLHSPEVVLAALRDLRPEVFQDVEHRALWRAIVAVFEDSGGAVDPVLVGDHLARTGQLEAVGGVDALTALAERVPYASHFEQHAKILRENLNKRELHKALMTRADYVLDPAVSFDDAREYAYLPDSLTGGGKRSGLFDRRMTAAELIVQYPVPRPFVIDGLFRTGQVATVVNASKSGKSWMMLQLCLSVASGRDFLGMGTSPGPVVLIDCELQAEDLSFRLSTVARAMGLSESVLKDVETHHIRGKGGTVDDIAKAAHQWRGAKLICVDPLYKVLGDADENSNSDMARVFDALADTAEESGAAVVVTHHQSKGGQSQKSVTDTGSGAGSISRASDLHLILRPHTVPGVSVVQAAVRSFAPLEAFCVCYKFPLWERASEDLDPTDLAGLKPTPGQKVKIASQDAADDAEAVFAFLDSAGGFQNLTPIVAGVSRGGRTMTERRVKTAVERLLQDKRIVFGTVKAGANNRRVPAYAVPNKAQQTDGGLLPVVAVCSRDKQDEQTARALSLEGGVGLSVCCEDVSPKKRSTKGTKKRRATRRRRSKKDERLQASPDAPETTPDVQDDQSPEQAADSVPSVAGERRATIVLDAADIVVREVSRGGA